MRKPATAVARFVEPTRAEFEEALEGLGATFLVPEGWRQWAVDVPTSVDGAVVRVSTTIDVRDGGAREKGQNAIDAVVVAPEAGGAFVVSTAGSSIAAAKVLRVPGWAERVRAHVEELLERAREVLPCSSCGCPTVSRGGEVGCSTCPERLARSCPGCEAPMQLRRGPTGPFWGCSTYPRCKKARPWAEEPAANKGRADGEQAAIGVGAAVVQRGRTERGVVQKVFDVDLKGRGSVTRARVLWTVRREEQHVDLDLLELAPAQAEPTLKERFAGGPEGSEELVAFQRARRLLRRFLGGALATQHADLATIAKKLLAVLERDPEGAVPLVLGVLTPNGKPTFESLLRRRTGTRSTVGRSVAWGEKPSTSSSSEARKGIVDYRPEDRPAEAYTEIVQGPEGGPSAPASAFPHHRIKHANLNAVQAAVLPYFDKDVNVVVAASTSAGKTTIAEMYMADALARKAKAIFLSPLRAVSQEKYDEWRAPEHPWGRRAVEIVTGDYTLTESRKKALRASDVIVMTSEMLDSKTRRIASEGNDWLLRVLCMVVDEAHLLTMEERGDALEAGLMRFSKQNPQARLVLLSATMPNVDELARWLTHLNGKPSVILRSEWRPTKLTVHWPTYPDRGQYHQKEEAKRVRALQILRTHSRDKFIVFVHAKKAGYALLDDLKRAGISAEFHNADLNRDGRINLERRFRTGDLRVVIATSTLAYGINMPARRVIVLGIHRGMEEVDPIDVKQEVGRAGRMGIDPEGDAYVLIPESQEENVRERFSRVGEIRSKLNDLDTLAFHLTAEVAEGDVSTEVGTVEWHSRSLAAFQGAPIAEGKALAPVGDPERAKQLAFGQAEEVTAINVLEKLTRAGILKRDETRRYEATMLGRVASWLYFSPFDVADWCSNFRKLLERDRLRDDECLAWALGCVRTAYRDSYLPREHEDDLAEVGHRLRACGVEHVRLTPTVLAAHGALKGFTYRGITALQRGFVQDSDRVVQAIEMIDKYVIKGLGDSYTKLLGARIRYGCGWREADLCRIPGVGARRASALVEAGVTSVAQVLQRPSAVYEALGKVVGASAIRGAKGLMVEIRPRRPES